MQACSQGIMVSKNQFQGKSAIATAGEFELMFTNTEAHKIVYISTTNQDNPNL